MIGNSNIKCPDLQKQLILDIVIKSEHYRRCGLGQIDDPITLTWLTISASPKVSACHRSPHRPSSTPDGELYAGANKYRLDYASSSYQDKAILLHEVYHVIQNQFQGWGVSEFGPATLKLQLQYKFDYNLAYDYAEILAPNSTLTFNDLNFEEKAALLEDYYLLLNGQPPKNISSQGMTPQQLLAALQNKLPTAQQLTESPDGVAKTDREFNSLTTTHEQKIIVDKPVSMESGEVSQIAFIKAKVDAGEAQPSPLVLDLNNNGVELTALTSDKAVYWDHNHDGFAEASGWVGANDGILAIDLNADGIINNGAELFGDQTGYANGFLALKQYDSNNDNQITSTDAQFGKTHYDDGGFSGGNMNCPALTQLMKDIEAGKIDIVVVYKVDRLSRSLHDFARMVETFDKYISLSAVGS